MQLSLRNRSNDFLTIDKIRSSAFSTLRIKCHAMKVFFISFVNVKFITHLIAMKLKQPKRLNVNWLSIKRLRVAKKLAWRLLLLSKKRCVEKKDYYVLKLFEILCFQNGNTSLKNGVNFFFSFSVGSL